MATNRTGFIDALHAARLQFVSGTTHPAAPAGTYLALYAGTMPLSDGTGGTEATGTRPSITFGSPQTDANGRQYITNTSAITGITLTNASSSTLIGFGIASAATGGALSYTGTFYPFPVAKNATITIAAGAIKVYAETTGL